MAALNGYAASENSPCRRPDGSPKRFNAYLQRLTYRVGRLGLHRGPNDRSRIPLCVLTITSELSHLCTAVIDRDRGVPLGAAPPTPPGIRVAYLGGSTRLSFNLQCRCEAGREVRRRDSAGPFGP